MKITELLSKKESWCKGAFAKDSEGKRITSVHPRASQWCLRGAITRCYPFPESYEIVERVMSYVGLDIPSWNDSPKRTHEDVIKLAETLDI